MVHRTTDALQPELLYEHRNTPCHWRRDLDHRRIDAINARPGHESKCMSALVQGVGFREGA